jgi:hypothetical protein
MSFINYISLHYAWHETVLQCSTVLDGEKELIKSAETLIQSSKIAIRNCR